MQFPVGHFFCDFGSAPQCIFVKSGSGIWKSTRGLCNGGEFSWMVKFDALVLKRSNFEQQVRRVRFGIFNT